MSQLYIPVLLGTGREGRQSEKVAKFVLAEAQQFGFSSELYDVRDYGSAVTVPSWVANPRAGKWREMVKKANGLIMVMPEYNHSYPGEFKLVLDSLNKEYAGLPVGLCTVSSGPFGGARMVENLLPVLQYLQMVAVPSMVHFASVQTVFNEQGELIDAAYRERVQKLFASLKTYAQVLAPLRASTGV